VRKLFQNNLEETVMRYEVIKNAQFYRQRLAVAATEEDVGRIVAAQAADELLNVSGVDASFVIYSEDGGQNISGRSSGDVNVQVILEDLGGGGNAAAAGAQLKDCTLKQATLQLQQAIDRYFDGEQEQ
jgi:c-di-AMP phosphodiesterase-like protein